MGAEGSNRVYRIHPNFQHRFSRSACLPVHVKAGLLQNYHLLPFLFMTHHFTFQTDLLQSSWTAMFFVGVGILNVGVTCRYLFPVNVDGNSVIAWQAARVARKATRNLIGFGLVFLSVQLLFFQDWTSLAGKNSQRPTHSCDFSHFDGDFCDDGRTWAISAEDNAACS